MTNPKTINPVPPQNSKSGGIVFEQVNKSFNNKPVLQGIDFMIPYGSRFVLYGPSGSGKSTILRLISGLIQPDSGRILGLEDKSLSLVFQEDRLFEEITCYDNIAYGLDQRLYSKDIIRQKVQYWAEVFRCTGYLNQVTSTLSGGQRQRAALARAFMKDPDIVLLDESFRSMDLLLREELTNKILELQKQRNFTLIVVTHSFEEAQKFGQQVLLLKQGKVLQKGTPASLYRNPMDLFEARTFGGFALNVFPASWLKDDKDRKTDKTGKTDEITPGISLNIPDQAEWVSISAFFCAAAWREDWMCLPCQFEESTDMGYGYLLKYNCQDQPLYVMAAESAGENKIYMDPEQLLFYDMQGNRIAG